MLFRDTIYKNGEEKEWYENRLQTKNVQMITVKNINDIPAKAKKKE